MKEHLKILLLEDSETDAEIVQRLFKKTKQHSEFKLVMNREAYISALDEFQPDLILSDNSMPQFSATEALEIIQKRNLQIPFIMVTGSATEEFAAEIIKLGADDYIIKDRMARLPVAIDAALKQKKAEREKNLFEKKIIESENNLKTIFENTSEGFLLMDTNGTVKAINKNGSQYGILAGKKEIEIGDHIFDVIEKDRREVFEEMIARVAKGEEFEYERSFIVADGNVRWIEFSIIPVKENEKITGICVNGSDITEKKKIEQEREFEKNNLAALINNTDDLIWSVDKNFRLITFNNSFGTKIKRASGKPIYEGSHMLRILSDKERSTRFKEYYERAFKGESFIEVEHEGDTWSEISFYPIRDQHDIIGTACFSRDITTRKKADAVLDTALKELSDYKIALDESSIVSITDHKGIITYVNSNFCRVSKYCPDELLGHDHRIVNSSFHDKAFIKKLWTTILAGKIWRNEARNKAKDGELFWVDATIVPFLDNKKKPIQFVAINKDITEKKLIEQELVRQKVQEQKRVTRAMIIAQEKERNHLGGELHDNINQILAGTKLYLGMVGNDNPAIKELIKYPIELIDSSIEEIRLLCHRLATPLKNIDLNQMVRDLLDNFSKNTTIKTGFNYSLPSLLLNDDLKLNIYRIIQEQINNIVKYAKAKNVNVTFTEKDKILGIIIKDDGVGFNVKSKSKGIGISNMMNRIESYNGEIEIISSPGNGCTIAIKIPC
jgi:PAS domain S-box-containing protein